MHEGEQVAGRLGFNLSPHESKAIGVQGEHETSLGFEAVASTVDRQDVSWLTRRILDLLS
jgi:hypothetical protein